MGIANVIPGVSGGTMAFVTGIYEELVHSIDMIDTRAWQLLRQSQFALFWKRINGNFLITVFAGVMTSLLLLSGTMMHLLKFYPIMTWSFFFGMIGMCVPLILRNIKQWTLSIAAGLLAGISIGYLITISSPIHSPDNIFFGFLAGAIAISAMVIPGISGVVILLLIGKYEYIVNALQERNVVIILVFVLGSIIGLRGISKLLAKTLHSHHQIIIAILSGFMVGALNKVWPWRKVIEYATNSKGDQIAVFDKSVLPWHFLSVTGKDPQLFQAIFMMALGVMIVVLIEKIAVRLKTKH